eukprot:GSChrysophyteH1.ASY1.ANO1.150.1 assembled CDS
MNSLPLNAAQVNIISEQLARTVARAFYPDTTVVVIDALVREKYIKETELAPRLRLKDKDIRAILSRLESRELLIKHESLLTKDFDGKNRQHKYYYIDYQMFVDIVRYRLFLMQRKVDSMKGGDAEIDGVKFECPSCHLEISMLEATRSRSADNKFVCTRCCTYDDFRNRMAEPSFTLFSKGVVQSTVQSAAKLKTKLHDAMGLSVYHDSIFALLKQLSKVRISRNLPSDNMRKGFNNTIVTDEDTRAAMQDSLGKSVAQKKGRYFIQNDIARAHKNELSIEVELDLHQRDNSSTQSKKRHYAGIVGEDSDDEAANNGKKKRAVTVPAFLQRSGVIGADDLYQLESLNATASYKAGNAVNAQDSVGNDIAAKEQGTSNLEVASLEKTTLPEVTTEPVDGNGDGNGDGDGDDNAADSDDSSIAWEDD